MTYAEKEITITNLNTSVNIKSTDKKDNIKKLKEIALKLFKEIEDK